MAKRHKSEVALQSLHEESMKMGMEMEIDTSSAQHRRVLRRIVKGGSAEHRTRNNKHGTTTTTTASNSRSLHLLFLGCEPKMAYGPVVHTGQLVLDLVAQAASDADPLVEEWNISMTVFDLQAHEFPTSQDWDACQGVVLPGSLAGAYENIDEDDEREWTSSLSSSSSPPQANGDNNSSTPQKHWIPCLRQLIRTQLLPRRVPTLGLCFGHQILAQALGGHVAPTPTGPRGGRFVAITTNKTALNPTNGKDAVDANSEAERSSSGQSVFEGRSSLEYFYTHGDRVERLPPATDQFHAVCLAGDEQVPNAVAAYYSSNQEKNGSHPNSSRPFAMTFQGHLEYASSRDLGLHRTLDLILDQMVDLGKLTSSDCLRVKQDAHESYDRVRKDSLETMVLVGRSLGWFPNPSKLPHPENASSN